jgi:uncharacterized coiled-coil DUF342 family protein
MDPSAEVQMLRAEADAMRSGLEEINQRIQELEKEGDDAS